MVNKDALSGLAKLLFDHYQNVLDKHLAMDSEFVQYAKKNHNETVTTAFFNSKEGLVIRAYDKMKTKGDLIDKVVNLYGVELDDSQSDTPPYYQGALKALAPCLIELISRYYEHSDTASDLYKLVIADLELQVKVGAMPELFNKLNARSQHSPANMIRGIDASLLLA